MFVNLSTVEGKGKKIKAIREAKGITLEQMAAVFNVGITTYAAREKKGKFPDEELSKIIKKLGMTRQQFDEYKTPDGEIILSLPEALITLEAQNDVIIFALAELLAKQTGQSVTGARNELVRAVREQYEAKLSELAK